MQREDSIGQLLAWTPPGGPLDRTLTGDRVGREVGLNFPGGSDGKESTCKAGVLGFIPGLGKPTGEGNDYPLQYSCLENSMDRGAWRAIVHGVTKGQT